MTVDDSQFETKHQCVKVKELRKISYASLEEWMNGEDNVYVGRKGRIWITGSDGVKQRFEYEGSKYCNPHCDTLTDYITHIYKSRLDYTIDELRGKSLGCFCDPLEDCHAKVLADMLGAKYGVYKKPPAKQPATSEVNQSHPPPVTKN